MWQMEDTTKGTITTISAFFLWGIFPIYWKALYHVPSTEILAHRVIWSLVFMLFLLSIQGRWKETKYIIFISRDIPRFLFTSVLLAVNWLTYIWAVNTNQIVEASLGYFINPLVNVCLGMIFLKERLYRWQVVSVMLAFIGVLFLTMQYGRVPWIAFTLAFSFGTYGLLRKTAKAGSMVGLLFETAILTPIALAYTITLGIQGSGAFFSIGLQTDVLLTGAGLVTAIPLLLFAHGARRIQYSTVGFLQYIAPTGQLLVGVFFYKELFTSTHAISFGFVWMAIIIYSISSLLSYKKQLNL
jgi:chloramphenicol-sensitive protein RarD